MLIYKKFCFYNSMLLLLLMPLQLGAQNYTLPSILPLPNDSLPTKLDLTIQKDSTFVEEKQTAQDKSQLIIVKPDVNEIDDLFGGDNEQPVPDNNEAINRQFFDFTIFLDRAFLQPVSAVFQTFTPEPIQQIVKNILKNLEEPGKAVFLVLSGRFTDGMQTLSRFALNSSFGIAGSFDIATSFGLKSLDGNADLMLASWGIPMGSYQMTPGLGPGHSRSSLSRGASTLLSPTNLVYEILFPEYSQTISLSMLGAMPVVFRPAALNTINDFADPYAVTRSVYWQGYIEREKNYFNQTTLNRKAGERLNNKKSTTTIQTITNDNIPKTTASEN